MGRLKTIPSRLSPLAPRIGRMPGDEGARLRERDAASPERSWYYTERWRNLRKRIWVRDNFICKMSGVLCLGTYPDPFSPVADHIIPHRFQEAMFWDEGNIQTLAKVIHDRVKQKIENGWHGDVDALIAKVLKEHGRARKA